jgi:alpha,alpha-trehalase
MFDADPSFRPVRRRDGYLALEDLALIGDGTTSALVGLDGSIPWLCLPRFDSEPLVCGLLDDAAGGSFTVAPDEVVAARQRYEPDTAVLVTELRGPTGVVAVTDALALRPGTDLSDDAPAGRQELIRSALVLHGSVRLRVELDPRGGASAEVAAGGLAVKAQGRDDLDLHLRSSRPLESLRSVHELHAGDRLDLVLSWHGGHRHHRFSEEELLAATARSWRRWMEGFHYDGPEAALVRRAALTLKLCDHWSNGALVAAPTSSLPAPIGGVRNWDYRYAWIRDASFSVYALRRIGFEEEAGAFLGWVLDTFEHGSVPKIMYGLDGSAVPDERVDAALEGYRRSAPVRWGNGAADQLQHDVYGELLDCAYQWVRGGGALDEHLWARLASLADLATEAWRDPDQGIWEVRSEGRVFTYSAGLCQVALDRAAWLGEQRGLPGPVSKWRRAADELRDTILEGSWNEDAQTLSAAARRRGRPRRQPARAPPAPGGAGRPSPDGGHNGGGRRPALGRRRPALPLPARGFARRHRRRRGRVRPVQLLARREPGQAGRAGPGRRALRLPVRAGELRRPAARADRPLVGRVLRQLPPGIQPHRGDLRRRHACQGAR